MTEPYNPYAAPTAVDVPHVPEGVTTEFYVVAPKKFWVLLIATLGLYSLYWFYKNWQIHRARTGQSMWPVMRAIFSVFFAHALFRAVDLHLRANDRQHAWNPNAVAWLYIVAAIINNAVDRLSMKGIGSPITDIVSLVMLPVLGAPLSQAQAAINAACGDPDGATNARFTGANHFWLLIGLAVWGLTAFGLLMPE